MPNAKPLTRRIPGAVLLLAVIAAATVVVFAAILASRGPEPAKDRLLAVIRPDGVYLIAPDGAERLLRRGTYADVAWAPDGTRLAVGERQSGDAVGIDILDVSGAPIGRAFGANLITAPIVWSPDGAHLILQESGSMATGGGDLVAFDTRGAIAWTARLPRDKDRQWRMPLTITWRPDGAWAAVDFRRERNLCHETVLVAASDPAHPATLFEDDEAVRDCIAHRPAWSSDGTQLAMLQSRDDCWPWQPDDHLCASDLVVYDMPADAAAPRPLPRRIAAGLGSYQQPLWLPGDDELLVTRLSYERGEPTTALFVVRADGGGERPVGVLATGDPRLRWATPGRTVLYREVRIELDRGPVPDPGDLFLFDLQSGTRWLLARDVVAAALQPNRR